MHLKIDVSYHQVAIAADATNVKSTVEIFQQFLLDTPFWRAPLICLSPWPLLLFICLLTRLRPSCWAILMGVLAEWWEMKQSRPPWPSGILPVEEFSAPSREPDGNSRFLLRRETGTERVSFWFPSPTPYPPRPVDRDMVIPVLCQNYPQWLTPIHQVLV